MFDRSLVTSGFDTEALVSEEYLTYLLLAQVEAGLLPLQFDTTDAGSGQVVHVHVHPPTDYTRRYPPHPDAPAQPDPQQGSLGVRLLPDGEEAFLFLLAWVTVEDGSGQSFGPAPAGMFVDLELTATEKDGFESRHQLRPSLVGLDPTTRAALQAQGVDPDTVEAEIRAQLDRPMPLGVAQGQKVQRIRIKKYVTDEQRSLGIYVDLALRSGPEPESYVAPRGDLDSAQDFRPPGAPMAFATSPGLFTLLGQDAKFRQAEATDSGGFRYPLREDPFDPESHEVGHIKGISVGPEFVAGTALTTGRLVIDVHGEYTDALGDPDFHLQLQFRPKRDADGVVTWDLDVDVDLGLLATIVLVFLGIGLTLLFGPGLAWGSTLIVGTLVGLAVLKGLIAEPLAARLVEEHLDEETDASVLDALPFRPPAAIRRWDPFYDTQHQVAALLDEDVVVDRAGIAFQAARLALDKEPVPTQHVVVRDEERTAGSVSSLRYRVSDFNAHRLDFDALAPGTDRMDFARADPTGEPQLVSLTNGQIADRIAARRLLAPITCTAERIHLVHGQIDALLVVSRRERDEQRQGVVDTFRREVFALIAGVFGDQIRATVIADLTDSLGRAPTTEEVTDEFNHRINALIDLMIPGFEEQLLPDLFVAALARTLRLDLAPEELIEQQLAGALILADKEIIVRHNRDGSTTPYYRDHPDGDPRDNLLSLPHYTPPYQPPA